MIDTEIVQRLVKSGAETNEVDFKLKCDGENEMRELVKDILAMSNF